MISLTDLIWTAASVLLDHGDCHESAFSSKVRGDMSYLRRNRLPTEELRNPKVSNVMWLGFALFVFAYYQTPSRFLVYSPYP